MLSLTSRYKIWIISIIIYIDVCLPAIIEDWRKKKRKKVLIYEIKN